MEATANKPPITLAQRRALGHFDFGLGFTTFVAGASTHIGSLLTNNPQLSEFFNVSSVVIFGVALLSFALMGYNLTKSVPSPKK